MKIGDIKTQRLEGKKDAKKTGTTSTADPSLFRALLEQQLPEVATPREAREAAALAPESQGVSPQLRLEGLALGEEAIDTLEALGQALANADLDRQALSPLIEALEGDMTGLLDLRAQLADSDPLARLIDRIATVAYLETEKYRRGDYDR